MKSTCKKRYTRFVALLAVGIIAIGAAHAGGWWDDDDQPAQVTELEQPDMADENVAKFSCATGASASSASGGSSTPMRSRASSRTAATSRDCLSKPDSDAVVSGSCIR